MEEQKAEWAKKMQAATRELRNETSKTEQLERDVQNATNELGQARIAAEQAQQALSDAKLAIQARDADIAVLKSRENKTVVEHVHVLEKAKRMTDRELAETRKDRDRLAVMVKSLEQQRGRTSHEHDELVRQYELLKAELAYEKRAAQTVALQLEDVQAERAARQAAEAAKMEAVRSHKSAQAHIAQLEQKLLEAKDAANKSQTPGKELAPSRLLQELQLNNEQLRNEMDEQLGRGHIPSDGVENSRLALASPRQRKSMDRVGVPASTSTSAIGTGSDSPALVKQQLLSAHMNASDRIRQHLLMQIDDSECYISRDVAKAQSDLTP
jgi:myosin protein heavy chain